MPTRVEREREAAPQTSRELRPRCKAFSVNPSQVSSYPYIRSLEGCFAVSYAGGVRKNTYRLYKSLLLPISALFPFQTKAGVTDKNQTNCSRWEMVQRLLSSRGREGCVQRCRGIPIYLTERSKVSCIVYIQHCTIHSALQACRKK